MEDSKLTNDNTTFYYEVVLWAIEYIFIQLDRRKASMKKNPQNFQNHYSHPGDKRGITPTIHKVSLKPGTPDAEESSKKRKMKIWNPGWNETSCSLTLHPEG